MQKLQGRVLVVGELQNLGGFEKREIILQTSENSKVCFTVIGSREVPNNLYDALVEVEYWPESREWNGKWYTTLKVNQIKIIES